MLAQIVERKEDSPGVGQYCLRVGQGFLGINLRDQSVLGFQVWPEVHIKLFV